MWHVMLYATRHNFTFARASIRHIKQMTAKRGSNVINFLCTRSLAMNPKNPKKKEREEKIENKFEMENLLITVDGSSTAIHHKNAHFPSEKKSIS
jgi:hypothetical protein